MAETSKPTRQLRLDSESASELECPVCLEYAVPPIVLCKIGHMVCGICRKGVERCAVCREAYTDTRNYAIENIVSKIKVNCRYKSCQEIHSVVKLEEHLKNCDYRPVVCNDTGTRCKDMLIDFDQFADHLTTVHEAEHPSTAITPFNFQVNSESCEFNPDLYLHEGVNFIVNAHIVNSVLYCWVSAILTKGEALNYLVDFRIGQLLDEKIDLKGRNIQWTMGVSPVHKTLQHVKKSGDCVMLPIENLIPFSKTATGEDEVQVSFFVEVQFRKKEQ